MGMVSDGMVAMKIGKVPLAAQPTNTSAPNNQGEPPKYSAASGTMMPMALKAMTTGLRPMRSDSPGTMNANTTAEIPSRLMR